MSFSAKDYPCQCHVCGREFVLVTTFLSTPVNARGRCQIACNADPSEDAPRHTADEIRSAFLGGRPDPWAARAV